MRNLNFRILVPLVFGVVSIGGCSSGGSSSSTTAVQAEWVSGSNVVSQSGVYGTKGVAAISNIPGARDSGVSWTDTNGNFWLFSGNGYDSAGNLDHLNDLWKYNIATSQWTWVSGANVINESGIYGTQGVAATSNVPGARDSDMSFIDANNNLWLFGGHGFDSQGTHNYLNDLWKFNISNGEWTWVSGSDLVSESGIYGTKGVAATGNIPGARGFGASFADASGNLWVFGGIGYDSTGAQGDLNDLWKYNVANGQWTWVSGSNVVGQAGNYGTKGVASSSNVPGARYRAVKFRDSVGNLWVFGGYGFDSTGTEGDLNDLWKYNIANGQWTWVSGSNLANQSGVYGTAEFSVATNMPGARDGAIAWIDRNGNFWIFGGNGYDSTGTADHLNDLWQYNVSTGLWTWCDGSALVNQSGIYGTKGIPAYSNVPGARDGSVGFIGSDGSLWLFGGHGFDSGGTHGDLNDLWRFI